MIETEVLKISSANQLVGLFDHAILQPTLTDEEMRKQMQSLRRYPVASVCVKPYAVKMAVEEMAGTEIAVGTVIGFPHGTSLPEIKAAEAVAAFRDGAHDVDMVVNAGKVLSKDWEYVRQEISAVLKVARSHGGIIKVIFETDYLTHDEDKITLCQICSELKVDYVKTSTGFGFVKREGGYGYTGATDHDVELMRRYSAIGVGVKPSGAVRSLDRVLRMVELGATRIGTASTQVIYEQALQKYGR
jgi:deoxyribose-phosphate aldolase